ERDAPSPEPFDKVKLPRGPMEIDLVAVETRDQNPELALVARARESRAADMIVDVGRRVFDPRLQRARQEIRVAELQVPRRARLALLLQFVAERAEHVAPTSRGRRKEDERPHVHERLARLRRQKYAIQRAQALLRAHRFSVLLVFGVSIISSSEP